MKRVFARKAFLPDGWSDHVRLEIADGLIQSVAANAEVNSADVLADVVIPGLCNAHSHAFQRALAGRTEQRSHLKTDNFWTWRERMYSLAEAMTGERLRTIARQAYVEMLNAGFTTVTEFHYLHCGMDGADQSSIMFDAIRGAALDAGIRLHYVPVLYERAGFDQPAPRQTQRRFALELDRFVAHFEAAMDERSQCLSVGIGAHSIRAVNPDSLHQVADLATRANCPLHLHIAEQQREVDECLLHYQSRPVEWLLDRYDVNSHWCLVHATHLNDHEVAELARRQAVVCLCPSTEANLGDGLFPLAPFLSRGGRMAIGSDSQICINPFEELRWLEYGQRLSAQARNIAAYRHDRVGYESFERALEGGAAACGMHAAGLTAGAAADLVVLSGDDPMLAGHDDATRLDALVFSGYPLPIDGVMVGGDWRVQSGVHLSAQAAQAEFAATMTELAGENG